MKRFLTLAGCFLASVFIVMFLPSFLHLPAVAADAVKDSVSGMFDQHVESIRSTPSSVQKIYADGQLLGIVSSKTKLDQFLDQIYHEKYEKKYPNSKAGFGENVYVTSEQNMFTYTNADEEIFAYLEENEMFTLEATMISFADENDVFDRIYVSDQKLYDKAMDTFLSFFISDESLNLLTSGKRTPELTDYGRRDIGVSIAETISVDTAYAPVDEIRTTQEEVLDFLEYGDDTKKEYYTVSEYDTVAGVGAKNYGLSAEQVMNINRDKIKSIDQVLKAGEELCVTYFNSPLTVNVTREVLRSEEIYPDTQYVQDENMYTGEQQTVQEGVPGSRNALYQETWVNGVLMKGTLLSSVDVKQPVDEIINVGTTEHSGVGTGVFQWPTDNPGISCGWGCYANHEAIDVINVYDRYGKVYAADSGVIKENAWHPLSGNYVVIDHNNGLYTYYAHMNDPSPLPVGTIVDKGEQIGVIGMTGNASGPHIHFYVGVGDPYNNTDPCDGYLNCDGY